MPRTKRIQKEELQDIAFREDGPYLTKEEQNLRYQKLYLAMLIGNNFHNKVQIIFNTQNGQKEVYTTIWATTDKFVVLKRGMCIPINAIVEVNLE